MEHYTDEESSSSRYGVDTVDNVEPFNDDEVDRLMRACQAVEGSDSYDEVEEVTVPDEDDEYSEYTLRSGQERNERNGRSFSTVNEESSSEEEETTGKDYTESSNDEVEITDESNTVEEEEYIEESHTAEEEEYISEKSFHEKGEIIDDNNGVQGYCGDLKHVDDTKEIYTQDRQSPQHSASDEFIMDQPIGAHDDSTLFDDNARRNVAYPQDVEDQLETYPFVNGEEEIIFEAEKNGIYYQGRSIGRGVTVTACLAIVILIFVTGFLSAFWSNPNNKRVSSATRLSPAPVAIQQTNAPSNTLESLPSATPSTAPSITTPTPTTLTPSQSPTRNSSALSQTIGRAIGQSQVDLQRRSQERAFTWLVSQDDQQLSFDDNALVQRFLLANLFFSASSWDRGEWLTNATECQWAGVKCNGDGKVSHLNLTGFGISSSIPTELQFLTALEVLDLSSNSFEGNIPDPLSAMVPRRLLEHENILSRNAPALQVLNLGQNNLDGVIPSSVGLMMNLISIKLDQNSFSGTIPVAIGLLPKLVLFDVSNNTLHGKLPTFFSQALSAMNIGSNNMSGSVDNTLCAALGPNVTEIVIDCDKIECSCCGSCTNPRISFFLYDKQDVDSVCGQAAFRQDDGERCEEICKPHFFECCNPFETDSLRYVSPTQNQTNLAPLNTTLLDSLPVYNTTQCSFGEEVSGCMAYSKCQSLTMRVAPAPSNLQDTCSFDRLQYDPQSCKNLCAETECCYNDGPDHCLTDQFETCMDYSPCQNLRVLYSPAEEVLETAPRELEFECLWGRTLCNEICELASCCSSPSDNCFQFNFLSCLTYSPCSATAIPPQFSEVSKPPSDLNVACSMTHNASETDSICGNLCRNASCCFALGEENCFAKDPLGCLAWSPSCLKYTTNSTMPSDVAVMAPSVFDANANQIIAACGRVSAGQDGGLQCKELCHPHFPELCRPFQTSNGTAGLGFVDNISNCVDYAKCQVTLEHSVAEPAPASLPAMCSMEQLEKDPGACFNLCRVVDCCFSSSKSSCMVRDFNLCLDYAPCQNLRYFEPAKGTDSTNSSFILPVAPRSLGMDCFDGNDTCFECEKANCCSNDGNDSCLRSNFISCLTYAACPPDTETVIGFPPRFSFVPHLPLDITDACHSSNEPSIVPPEYSCEEYCEIVACCFSDGVGGCFQEDPLGCLEWHAHCQVVL